MDNIPIYTIGYGNREINEFLSLLVAQKVEFLIDVRTSPKGSYNQDFIGNNLKEHTKTKGIRYVFMGDLLGGRPPEEECYTNGKVDYRKVSLQPFYKKGLSRLKTAYDKNLCVALMCSEQKPESCHRSKLIGESLTELGIEIVHIDEKGKVINQQMVLDRITGGQLALFEEVFTSRKKYLED
ncbi:DUF488 domain-containing protein [Lysinibacillus sphaericus]|uniref:DUF488 domain-containing protein n=1 Tax=Lysinibacillus sphaericus TaxID=1421 RepID=UPI001E2D6002|nr:DUF488 domain-containing protein [Lysinibacillus sphaericus]UDK98250.1 DUF488 domain-containing protein [Lysinibacillus sphaericus]